MVATLLRLLSGDPLHQTRTDVSWAACISFLYQISHPWHWLNYGQNGIDRSCKLINQLPMDEPLPLKDLQTELQRLEDSSPLELSDELLLAKIRSLHHGFEIIAPGFPARTVLFRAVRVTERPVDRSRISYAPPRFIRTNGRLNKAGQSMFFGAFSFFTCLVECGWQVGEFFAVSAWLTKREMLFHHLGYSRETFDAYKAKRNLPFFAQATAESERNRLLREWQARVFTQHVPRGREELYRLPISLKDFAMSAIKQLDPNAPQIVSGVVYPSVAFHLLGDNVAILPSEVDQHMALFEVILLTLDGVNQLTEADGSISTDMRMKPYDHARPDAQGNLIWVKRAKFFSRRG